MDENSAIGIRQGPGCEYKSLPEATISSVNQGITYNVIGKHGDWWLIDLGNQSNGWVFGPVYKDNNFKNGDEKNDIPEIEISPALSPFHTESLSASIENTIEEAGHTLIAFFNFLHEHDYKNASELFGTSLNWLIMWNPNIDPSDHSMLLQASCEVNGFDCLQIKRIVESAQISNMEFLFTVEFLDNSGNTYRFRGPVATNASPPSQFQFRVIRDCDGSYFVVTYPVYGG
jgi:hypothetical protein